MTDNFHKTKQLQCPAKHKTNRPINSAFHSKSFVALVPVTKLCLFEVPFAHCLEEKGNSLEEKAHLLDVLLVQCVCAV